MNDFTVPLEATGSQGQLREALVSRVPYVIADTEAPTDFLALDAATGGLPWAIVYEGRVFALDPNDTTTASDGISTIVSSDGYRYKVEAVAGMRLSVINNAITTPPATPLIGDAYLVPAGAVGDWAPHPDEIAVWTARGWMYTPPEIGMSVYVESALGFYHYNQAGDWVAGFGSSAVSPNSVPASALIGGRTHWVVVNQTTNTPPVSPSTGVAYIVGPAPTGAWVGQTAKIAVWQTSLWVFYSAQEGWTAYDQALNTDYVFNGTWLAQASGYGQVLATFFGSASTPAASGTTAYTYSDTTAPTVTNRNSLDPLSLNVQASFAGQFFEIEYALGFTSVSPTTTLAVALFVDSGATAVDWVRTVNAAEGYAVYKFSVSFSDTSVHNLRFRLMAGSGAPTFNRRRITARRIG